MPPVSPKSRELPFGAPEFSWSTFEGFFCDFLSSQPSLPDGRGSFVRVNEARLYGRKGDRQEGIDIEAKMENGEIWVFQCKHYPKASFSLSAAEAAIKKCTYIAERKFLLITREVSEDCHRAVAEHEGWQLWDSRRISSEFLGRVDPLKGAAILYRCFGPGWAEALFDLPTSLPLIGAEAHFGKTLRAGRTFHHRHRLIGRSEELRDLHAFVKSKNHEVLLLPGRAGLGKSRLLLEFSRTFNRKHPGMTLYFVSDEATDSSGYKKAIDAAPKPLVLVLDDAHRLGEVRRALLPVIGKRDDVKIVLSLRPGPTNQIRGELGYAGYDSRAIEEWPALREFSSDEARTLAEIILIGNRDPRNSLFFATLAVDSPLLAVMGAELLASGVLGQTDLMDTPEFRDRVLTLGFESDIEPLFQRFGENTVRTFAKLLALLGPLKLEGSVLDRLSTFSGVDLQTDVVNELAEVFDQAGLLYETESGYRIVPDLLSDHLAFSACYDLKGRDKTFATRVIQHFDPGDFPRIVRHLAEAEWQASRRLPSNDSIMGPVWDWFEARFRNSSFYERRKQLDQWADIAHFQPERTIQLAELAVDLTEAPEAGTLIQFWVRELDGHDKVVGGIPNLLKPLANSHPHFTGRCFDLLWALGKDRELPAQASRVNSHPILVMGEISKFEFWKSLKISEAALAWVKKTVLDGSLSGNRNSQTFLFSKLLKPFFSVVSEETWMSGDMIYTRTYPLITQTAPFRTEALSLCRDVLEKRELPLAFGVVSVLEKAIRPLWIPYDGKPSAKQKKEWDVEREKALGLLSLILRTWDDPLLHFRIRRILSHEATFSKSVGFKKSATAILEEIPDSFELRLARVFLSYDHGEFDEDVNTGGCYERVKERWSALVTSVADELVLRYPDSGRLTEELRRHRQHALDHGFSPNPGPILNNLSERHPGVALEMANRLIHERAPDSGELMRCLIGNATKPDPDLHVRLCREAVESGEPGLIAGAIESLSWMRRFEGNGALPEEGWALIFLAVANADERIFRAAMHFLWVNDIAPTSRDWQLIALLADPGGDELRELLVRRCSDLLRHGGSSPEARVIETALGFCTSTARIDAQGFDHALRGVAEHFPGEVYCFFWSRCAVERASENWGYTAVPLGVEGYPFDGILENEQVAGLFETAGARLLNGPPLSVSEEKLLRALLVRADVPNDRILAWIELASTWEQLKTLIDFAKNQSGWPFVLQNPEAARSFLLKSRSMGGEELHAETFRRLSLLSGCRSSTNGEPDPEWRGILESAERLAHRYSGDPELGPLYAAAVAFERDQIDRNRRELVERRGRR
jgi:hypothetical protein